MDGFGLSDAVDGNAIKAAKTPILDKLFAENAHTSLSASGLDVGLPAFPKPSRTAPFTKTRPTTPPWTPAWPRAAPCTCWAF